MKVAIHRLREVGGDVPSHLAELDTVEVRTLATDPSVPPWHTAMLLADVVEGPAVLRMVDAAVREWLPMVLDADLPGHAQSLRLHAEIVDERTARQAREAVLVALDAARTATDEDACDSAIRAAKLGQDAADHASDVLSYLPDSPEIRTSLLRLALSDEEIRHWYHAHGSMHAIGTVDAAHRGDPAALRLIARDLDEDDAAMARQRGRVA